MAIATNIPPETTDLSRFSRWLAAALLGTTIAALVVYALITSAVLKRVQAARTGAVIAALNQDGSLDTLRPATIRSAVTAKPLDQGVANVAMAYFVHKQGNEALSHWVPVLDKMGWRNTTALLNLLYVAALQQNIPAVVDISDGLLRRQNLANQLFPALLAVEADPRFRPLLVKRLAYQPVWKSPYLGATNYLKSRDQLVARFAFLQQLRKSGGLRRSTIATNVIAFNRGGMPDYAMRLWESVTPDFSRPLNDTNFSQVSQVNLTNSVPVVPFQWKLNSGDGYNTDAFSEDGDSSLYINWNGRGVPVFVQQRTTAAPGRYMISVKLNKDQPSDIGAIGFRLVCDGETTAFEPVSGNPTRFTSRKAVDCAFPLLQITGNAEARATSHQIALDSITMRTIADAG